MTDPSPGQPDRREHQYPIEHPDRRAPEPLTQLETVCLSIGGGGLFSLVLASFVPGANAPLLISLGPLFLGVATAPFADRVIGRRKRSE